MKKTSGNQAEKTLRTSTFDTNCGGWRPSTDNLAYTMESKNVQWGALEFKQKKRMELWKLSHSHLVNTCTSGTEAQNIKCIIHKMTTTKIFTTNLVMYKVKANVLYFK